MSCKERSNRVGTARQDLDRTGARRLLYTITSTDFGGAESSVRDLALGLRERSFEATVCSLCAVGRTGREIESAGVQVLSLGLSERPRLTETLGAVRQIAAIIDDLEIDLVHSCLYRANAIAGLGARMSRRRPWVLASQHSLTAPRNSRLANLVARFTFRWLADGVIAVSQAIAREYEILSSVPAGKVVVIENGIDTRRFHPPDDSDPVRRKGARDTPLAIAVGRLAPVKGLRYLFEALADLRDKDIFVRLQIAGDGPQRRELQALANQLGLTGSIQFLGIRSDTSALYRAADIFVLPSIREASPVALLEAMASGCCVIATRVGGIPTTLEDGRSALLIDPGSVSQLGSALRRVVLDVELRRRLGREAARTVEKRFSLERMVDRYEELYRSFLSNDKRTRSRASFAP